MFLRLFCLKAGSLKSSNYVFPNSTTMEFKHSLIKLKRILDLRKCNNYK